MSADTNFTSSHLNSLSFLNGGGELGAITRTVAWESNQLGTPDQWPQSLRTTLSIVLNSKFPMFLFWGPDHICFYNDAYRPSLGNEGKHPSAVGKPGAEVWPEIWSFIKPMIDQVLAGGEATWYEDQLLPIYRNGKIEDVYWTFSYSPVNDETGSPAGVFVTCTETTDKVVNLGRLAESSDQLRFAIESAELGTWDYNPVTNTFIGNARLKEWFGLPSDSDIDLSLAIGAMKEKDQSRVADAIAKAMDHTSGGFYDIEYTITNPISQHERIVRAKGRAWFNAENVAYRFNGTLQDITKQATYRKVIEDSSLRFRNLVNSAPVAICVFNGRDLTIEDPNPAMIEILGKGNSIAGKPLADVMPELSTEGQPFLKILREIFVTGKVFQTSGTQVKIVKQGVMTENYYDFTYTPLFDEANKVYAILGVALDVTPQVMAQQVLERSETNLKNIILQAPVAMCLLRGREFVVDIANEKMLELWGKRGEELLGIPIFEGLPEAKGQGFEGMLTGVIETGKTFHANELEIKLPRNGAQTTLFVDFVYEPFRETDGTISGVMAVAIDVTEKVQARKNIEESELFAKNILHNSEVSQILLVGKDLVVTMANTKTLELIGRDESIIGKPFLEALPELRGTTVFERLRSVFETGVPHHQSEEPVVLIRHGVRYQGYYSYTYKALTNISGERWAIIGTSIEVTDQVVARKLIEEAQQKAQLAISSAELGTYELDLNTESIKTDDRFNSIWGIEENSTRQAFSDMIHRDDREVRRKAHEESLKTGVLDYEARLIQKDGSIRWVKAKGKIIYGENNKPLTLLGVIQDITAAKSFTDALNRLVQERTEELQSLNEELVATNEEVEDANRLLVQTNHSLEQFNYAASHDMQEPLRKIDTFLNLFKERNGSVISEQGEKYLSRIEHSVLRMRTIINDLLTYSHETRKDQQFETVDLNQVVDSVNIDLDLLIQEKNAEVTIAALPKVDAIQAQVNQLFQNLISNALKFSKEGVTPKIEITAVELNASEVIKRENLDSDLKFVQIDVCDNGIGFDPVYADQIFELFKRLHNKSDYEGTGIGLALCKKIVENHKGDITVTSQPGVGTTFHVVLPYSQVKGK